MTAILHTLWRMGFQASILILIVLAARLLLKKYSGLYTRLLWLLVMVRLLCPVFIETQFSLLPEFPFMQSAQDIPDTVFGNASQNAARFALLAADEFANRSFGKAANHLPLVDDAAADAHRPPALPGNRHNAELDDASQSTAQVGSQGTDAPRQTAQDGSQGADASRPTSYGTARTKHIVSLLLPVLYLIGALTLTLLFAAQFFLLKRRISTAVCENGNIWLCENIASPFVIGILSPRIILPYHMPPSAKEHVLAHEQTHIRHRDPLLHFAGTLCLCLHWWNPLVWLAVHKINQDMEMFCDEATLRLAADGQRKDYAKTLLSFAEHQSGLHAGPAFGESNTERRVKNIMKKQKKNFLVLGFVLLLTVFCAAAFMTIPKTEENDAAPTGSHTDNHGDGGYGNSNLLTNTSANINQNTANHVTFEIDVYSTIQNIFLSTPDFASEEDMDSAFWSAYLFSTFTNLSGKEAEEFFGFTTVTRSMEAYASDTAYYKIAADKLDETTIKLFGKAVSDQVSNPHALTDGSNIFYEDGCYYVRISEFPDSSDYFFGSPILIPLDSGTNKMIFTKYQRDDDFSMTQVTLYLQPAETEFGYILIGKEEETLTPPDQKLAVQISDKDIAALQQSTLFMPDFSGESDLGISFWKDYLFQCYSQNFLGENVNRYSKHRDMTTAYAKVSTQTLDAQIRALFGKVLSEYVPNPQDLSQEDGDIIYEDGYYYIRIPSKSHCVFEDASIQMADDGHSTTLTFYTRVSSHAYPDSKTTLSLAPAENENGYILVGKQEEAYDFTSRPLTGTWAVTSYFIPPHAPTDGLSQEEMEQFVGTQLKFGPDYLMVGKDTYFVGEYRKELLTAKELDDLFAPGTGEALSLSDATFHHYDLQTAQGEHPFGSQVYRYDFENAFVMYGGVLFRIVELTEDLQERTVLDEYEVDHFALPDENGFVEGLFVPIFMLPGSNIYYTDDTHYIIVKGGISPEFDTQQKVDAFYADSKKKTLEFLQNGVHVLALSEPASDHMIATYDMYGSLMHIYPHDYPREKLAEGSFNWRYDEEDCRAVVAGFDTEEPKLYYQAAGKDWKIYPLPGLENLTEEEADSIVVVADAQKVVVTVTREGREIVKEIEVVQDF